MGLEYKLKGPSGQARENYFCREDLLMRQPTWVPACLSLMCDLGKSFIHLDFAFYT